MKIVYVSNAVIPSRRANAIHIMKFCSAIAQIGHEVVLIHPHIPWFEEQNFSTPFEFYGVRKNFKIVKIAWFPFCNKMSHGLLKWTGFILKTISYPLLASLYTLRLQPDLIYSRYLPASFWAAYLKKIPLIYEHHDFFIEMPSYSRKMLQILLNRGILKNLVVISTPLAIDYQQRLPFNSKQIIVAPDAADENFATADKSLLRGKFNYNIGFVGHIYPGRGMEIIAKLAEKMPDFAFHIIGGNENDIKYWKNKCSDLHNIFFYGFIPPSEVPKYIKSMDLLLAPYQKNVSTMAGIDSSNRMSPLKIFEYMASGVPFIASDIPVLEEAIERNKTAILCPHDKPDEWKNAILELKNNPHQARLLAENALKKFKNEFTWLARAEKIFKNFNQNTKS